MDNFVSGIFSDSKQAGDAVAELKNQGYTDKISVVAKDASSGEVSESTPKVRMDDTLRGVLKGGVLGAIVGIIASIVSIAIPGLGFLIVGGPLLLSWGITGAAIGALTGGIVGALKDLGIPEDTAKVYEDRIKRGDVLITVETDENNSPTVEDIFRMHGAEEIFVK